MTRPDTLPALFFKQLNSSLPLHNLHIYMSKEHRHICQKEINMVHKVYATYLCWIIAYTIQIGWRLAEHLLNRMTPWRTFIWPNNNQLVLSVYCLVLTFSLFHLDLILLRGARGYSLFLCGQYCWNLELLRTVWLWCALVDMYGCMNCFVCVYSSGCTGWLPLFSSWFIWHIQTLSESLIREFHQIDYPRRTVFRL